MIMQPAAPQPAPAAPTPPKPVMDIMPSHPAEPVKMPPKEAAPAPAPQPAASAPNTSKMDEKLLKPTVQKPPKPPRSGAGLAIAATVIIILGLGAMMTYAYLRTQGISQ